MSTSPIHPIGPKLTKSEQSRINGAKSKGPTTPGGKARSSRNALKHGLTAEKHAVLDVENPAEYKAIYDAAIDEFRPHSLFALRLVEKLAHLDWRIERLAMLETAYLNHKINEAGAVPQNDPFTEVAQSSTGELADLVRGWISAVGSLNALELLRRYTGTLQHQFNTTFSNYEKLETRSIARRRDREQDPNFLPPYQKPDLPEAATPISRSAPATPPASCPEPEAVPQAAAPTELPAKRTQLPKLTPNHTNQTKRTTQSPLPPRQLLIA